MKIIDITKELFSTEPYGDDTRPSYTLKHDMKKGFEYNLSELTISPHNATHIDAPLHFIDNGDDVSKMSLEKCFGSCYVVEERFVSLSTADALTKNAKRILFKGKVDISFGAAGLLAERLELIGTEEASIGNTAVHRALLRSGVVILENLDLSKVDVGNFVLCALPIKASGLEASPCRAVLFDSQN